MELSVQLNVSQQYVCMNLSSHAGTVSS